MSQLTRASLTAVVLLLLAAAAAGAGCQGDIVELNSACYQYVQKDAPTVPPSQECCDAVQGADVPCVCGYLGSPGVRENISMDKVFYVTKQCGVSIPANCGGSKHV